MRPVLLIAAVLLMALPLTAPAAKKCRENASGNVTCTQTSGDRYAQPGAVRDKSADAEKSKQQKPSTGSKNRSPNSEDTGVGSSTSQSREPGMTY